MTTSRDMRDDLLETRQARYFVAVAEELHFGRAAERLQMSQPPLSQAIQRLERHLGTTLLVRSSRAVSMTDAGREFLVHCRALLAAADRAEAAASDAGAGRAGRLRIAAVTSAFITPLPNILQRFAVEYPQVELRFTEVDTGAGVEALHSREVDLAIIRWTSGRPALQADPISRDHLALAVPTSAAGVVSERGAVDLADAASEQWVWIPREVSPGYHDDITAACRRAGFSPRPHHRASSIQSQLSMVACGLGVALVPASTATPPPTGVRLRPLVEPVELVDLALVRQPDAPQPLVEHFVQVALDVVSTT